MGISLFDLSGGKDKEHAQKAEDESVHKAGPGADDASWAPVGTLPEIKEPDDEWYDLHKVLVNITN